MLRKKKKVQEERTTRRRRERKEVKPEISLQERKEKITKLAYEFFIARDRELGHHGEDWLNAEEIIDSQYTVKSS